MSVLMLVVVPLLFAIRFRRNHGACARLTYRLDERVCIVSLVCGDGVCRDAFEQSLRLRHIVGLTGRESPARQLAKSFDQCMNLGGQSAARTAERLIAVFVGAPAACW